MDSFKICGPKLSTFGTLISIWGIIQLSLMALAFHVRAIAMIDDVLPGLSKTPTDANISQFKEVSHIIFKWKSNEELVNFINR